MILLLMRVIQHMFTNFIYRSHKLQIVTTTLLTTNKEEHKPHQKLSIVFARFSKNNQYYSNDYSQYESDKNWIATWEKSPHLMRMV